MKKTENNIKLARADVSFWWHHFCVKEGFYFGEMYRNGKFIHFCTSGTVKDDRLYVYFQENNTTWTPKWVSVGTQSCPVGYLGRAFWKKIEVLTAMKKWRRNYDDTNNNNV